METKRASWASNLGFLMAAIGSAVGLGNIWGFPYKMGKSGGFAYLAVYALLAIFVGFIVMASELAMGRKTGQGAMGTYHALTKKFRWIGWLALFSPFAVMGFYAVLGGYCIEYMALNLSNFAFGSESLATGGELFAAMLSNPAGAVLFAALFLALCYLINRSGISGGIEKFNNVGMPTLFVMLVVIIIRSLTLPGAMEGLKFMFVPGYAVEAGFVAETPSLLSVFASAGGQMFFSLSLAMGAMITYGSYLNQKEDLVKNSAIIVFADTLVATMAGIAVIPAAVANGIASGTPLDQIKLGPEPVVCHLTGCVPGHGHRRRAVRRDFLSAGADCRHFLRHRPDRGGHHLFPGPGGAEGQKGKPPQGGVSGLSCHLRSFGAGRDRRSGYHRCVPLACDRRLERFHAGLCGYAV